MLKFLFLPFFLDSKIMSQTTTLQIGTVLKEEKKTLKDYFDFEAFVHENLQNYITVKDLNKVVYEYLLDPIQEEKRKGTFIRYLSRYVQNPDLWSKLIHDVEHIQEHLTLEICNNCDLYYLKKDYYYNYEAYLFCRWMCKTCWMYCPCFNDGILHYINKQKCQLCKKYLCKRHAFDEETYVLESNVQTTVICNCCVKKFNSLFP